ncbi:hypothetical protein Glove_627g9 [Diversispora epigaea]|uniref:Uncharacterized protein n=1 Tax=Diversispora epigaea TaxID=1348612 RepID=A0A397GDW9_9GLOM|nr:hypothetical protein Glove_627g9 [Diversispora epigaea]
MCGIRDKFDKLKNFIGHLDNIVLLWACRKLNTNLECISLYAIYLSLDINLTCDTKKQPILKQVLNYGRGPTICSNLNAESGYSSKYTRINKNNDTYIL